MYKYIITLYILSAIAETKHLPPYIKPCRRSDPKLNECFAQRATAVIKRIAHGDPNYGLKSLTPLKFRGVLTLEDPPLKLFLIHIKAYGLENFTVSDAKIDLKNKSIKFVFSNPRIFWKTKYSAEINDNGTIYETEDNDDIGEVFLRNGEYAMGFEYILETKNGTEYASINKHSIVIKKVDLGLNFKGLENDPQFSSAWQKMKKDFIKDVIKVDCSQTTAGFINKIFRVVPFNEVFPP